MAEEPTLEQRFGAWTETEKVAMHFNEVLLSFRLKAIGALTVAAGLVATFAKTSELGPVFLVCGLGLTALVIVWLSIYLLDEHYYQRLLQGAVGEAIRQERAMGGDFIGLSASVKQHVDDHVLSGRRIRQLFYLLPAIALVAGATTCFAAYS